MMLLAFPHPGPPPPAGVGLAFACISNIDPRDRPNSPDPPTRSRSRRETFRAGSQVSLPWRPGMTSMGKAPGTEGRCQGSETS